MSEKRTMRQLLSIALALVVTASCAQQPDKTKTTTTDNSKKTMTTKTETITFGSGCFWCTEAIFQQLTGVISATSGYSGGKTENPTYKDVCSGNTGHAEVVQVVFDPSKVTIPELLEVFWKTHDPTTLNKQGADVGTQYRSAIFYHTPEQKKIAEEYKKKLDASGAYDKPIVTEIAPFTKFYKAENYHMNYYNQHGSEPYCQFVIQPKIDKFKKVFGDKIKK
jgi:peptide-methionine (S)-S-oxide reductase